MILSAGRKNRRGILFIVAGSGRKVHWISTLSPFFSKGHLFLSQPPGGARVTGQDTAHRFSGGGIPFRRQYGVGPDKAVRRIPHADRVNGKSSVPVPLHPDMGAVAWPDGAGKLIGQLGPDRQPLVTGNLEETLHDGPKEPLRLGNRGMERAGHSHHRPAADLRKEMGFPPRADIRPLHQQVPHTFHRLDRAVAVPCAAAAGSTGVVTGTTTGLLIRSGPGREYEALATATNGATVTILEDTGTGWYHISYQTGGGNSATGYVSKDYITVR